MVYYCKHQTADSLPLIVNEEVVCSHWKWLVYLLVGVGALSFRSDQIFDE